MQSILPILPYIQGTLAVLLMGVILLQQRGTSLGSSFGGDSATYNSRRGLERTLFIATIIIAVLFVASALLDLFVRI